MLKAIDEVWKYTGEIFMPAAYETIVDVASLKNTWLEKVRHVFTEATLAIPENIFMQSGGKEGIHTEQMGFILTELQYVQRAYPDSQW
jgi:ring-1,2-phenylacetyl-CoA epoxidase subunit PaaC